MNTDSLLDSMVIMLDRPSTKDDCCGAYIQTYVQYVRTHRIDETSNIIYIRMNAVSIYIFTATAVYKSMTS